MRRDSGTAARVAGGGERELLLWGGNANNGTNAGLGYANSNNAFSNTNANYGSRLTKTILQPEQAAEFPKPWP